MPELGVVVLATFAPFLLLHEPSASAPTVSSHSG
jgi:hypothetical protein